MFDVECNEDIFKKKSFYTRGNFDAVPSGHIHLCFLVALKWLVTTLLQCYSYCRKLWV